jgi:hypothetical protein
MTYFKVIKMGARLLTVVWRKFRMKTYFISLSPCSTLSHHIFCDDVVVVDVDVAVVVVVVGHCVVIA